MGSPLAPILADIFMNIILETHIEKRDEDNGIADVEFYDKSTQMRYVVRCFTRYVDDILAAFESSEKAHEFLAFLNSEFTSISKRGMDETDIQVTLDLRLQFCMMKFFSILHKDSRKFYLYDARLLDSCLRKLLESSGKL